MAAVQEADSLLLKDGHGDLTPSKRRHRVSQHIWHDVVHAWVGQIVTFFAYRPPSRPLGSLTPTQPGRVTNPTQGHPEPPWEAPQAECWLLRREPKPGVQHTNMSLGSRVLLVYS